MRLAATATAASSAAAQRLVDQYLGPVDGRASERCWRSSSVLSLLRPAHPKRQRLATSGRGGRMGTAVAAGAAALGWTLVELLARAAYPAYRVRARVQRRQPVDPRRFATTSPERDGCSAVRALTALALVKPRRRSSERSP